MWASNCRMRIVGSRGKFISRLRRLSSKGGGRCGGLSIPPRPCASVRRGAAGPHAKCAPCAFLSVLNQFAGKPLPKWGAYLIRSLIQLIIHILLLLKIPENYTSTMCGGTYTLDSVISRFVATKVHVVLRSFVVVTWMRDIRVLM